MSANELDMKVNQIRELKRIIEEAEAEITSIEDTIKATMTEQNTDELRGANSKVTWKVTSTTRNWTAGRSRRSCQENCRQVQQHYQLSAVSDCIRKGR